MNHFPGLVKCCRKEMLQAEVTAYTKARKGNSIGVESGWSPEQGKEVKMKGNRAENVGVIQGVGASDKSW